MTHKGWLLLVVAVFALTPLLEESESKVNSVPGGFVHLASEAPSIQQDIRYFSQDNFLGRRVKGYEAAECILTKDAAVALSQVQQDVLAQGYSLKVYDCYRPQQAVHDFVDWAKNNDQSTKPWFYPNVAKAQLFQHGYD